MSRPKHIKERFDKLAQMGCIVCRVFHDAPEVPTTIHHIGNGTMGKRSPDERTIPLCLIHHQHGGYGIAVHAGRKAFEAQYATEAELLEWTNKALEVME